MLSYWEKTTLRHFDLVVVGGGIVGHFTALFYAQKNPEHRVAILERGLFPSGASTKNAGFACFGSIAELEHDVASIGEEATAALVMKRYNGLKLLRETLGDEAIDYREVGGYEMCFEPPKQERIDFFNDLLEPHLGKRPYSVQPSEGYGFSTEVTHLIKNALEGTVDTGKMMAALQQKVAQAGVLTFTQSTVENLESTNEGKTIYVQTADGSVSFFARQVALCTNAFSRKFLAEEELEPGRGLVLVSKPHPAFHWEGSFHYHDGYNYFRTVDGRLLLGGGRHLDKPGETTLVPGINSAIEKALKEDIASLIAPGVAVEIDYLWSGVMAFGSSKQPVIKRIDDHMVAGIRLGGMGVAIGARVGKDLAALIG
ncbi:MAG: FAD-dependent oxidoreductase [Cryomorphaceae bacterium]